MSLSKILLTGFAALTLATPAFAHKNTECGSELKSLSHYIQFFEDKNELKNPKEMKINFYPLTLTSEKFTCISDGVKKRTNGKNLFIRYQDIKTNTNGYQLIRFKDLF